MKTITFKGEPVTLPAHEVKEGDQAPEFTVLANDFSEVTLKDSANSVRIISVVPSIDTGVCSAQTRRFHVDATKIEGVKVLTISCDLPFAQVRWCAAEGLENIAILSDHRDLSFGEAYGVTMKEWRLLARSVFVVDSSDKVVYVEYVSEGTSHPNYEAALEAARIAK